MPRPGVPIVIVCVAIAAFAAIVPGACGLEYAIFSPSWVLLADSFVLVVRSCTDRCDEQPVALLSLAPSRAPPIA
jgi:hypothetical protein